MSLRRRGGPPRRTRQPAHLYALHVVVEGEKTEAGYLLPWRRDLRDRVLITVDASKGNDPLTLVRRAADVKLEAEREAAHARGRAFDEVWAVFDRDEHPNITPALGLAERHGINVVLSDPCIELWFILHFEEKTAWIRRDDAQRRAASLLGCGKTLTPAAARILVERYDHAKARAVALDAKHVGDGSPPMSNPSSNMWRLIDRVRNPPQRA